MRRNLSWGMINRLSILLGILGLAAVLGWSNIIIHGWVCSRFLIALFGSLWLIVVLLKYIQVLLWLVNGLFTPVRGQWIFISLLLEEIFKLLILALQGLWNDSLIQWLLRRDHLNLIIIIWTRFYHWFCATATPASSMIRLLFEFEGHRLLLLLLFLEADCDLLIFCFFLLARQLLLIDLWIFPKMVSKFPLELLYCLCKI